MKNEMYQQMNLFAEVSPKYKITKPIKLIEVFAGIGSQFMALKQLTDKVESHRIVEWSYKSIEAYNSIHLKDFTDYSKDLSKEELIDAIMGISSDYKKPMTREEINRKGLPWIQNVYNNIKATHCLINVMDVHGPDLGIDNPDKYDYVMTYSYPCQAVSKAGKMEGMKKGSGTTSSLIWEIDRILSELNMMGGEHLPKILVLENVVGIMEGKNLKDFEKFELHLTELGYSNHIEILTANDYGLPQHRERIFMVSILGDYTYDKPIKMDLAHYLQYYLENDVDEKYYLSQKMIDCMTVEEVGKFPRKDRFLSSLSGPNKRGIANTITTKAGTRPSDNFILIREKNKKGYAIAHEGDGVYINRPEQKRGCVQKGMIQTIKTSPNDIGVVLFENENFYIRKLTPKETYRLMGFRDCDYQVCHDIGQSDTAIFHQAGDSIVVPTLIAVLSPLFSDPSNHREIIQKYIETIKGD